MSYLKYSFQILFLSFLLISCEDNSNSDSQQNSPNRINLRQTGDSANELLSDTQYTGLTLELVSVTGFEPTQAAIDSFIDFINERVNKPDGITILRRSVASPNMENFNTETIDKLERDLRSSSSTANNHSLYIFFADQDHEDTEGDSAILGTAYRNTSMVIYESTLRSLASRSDLVSLEKLETSTLRHEFCHLLGLVNLGTPLQSEHEDRTIVDGEPIRGHCNVANCLMEANINFVPAIMNMMLSAEIPKLDPLCIQDLQANGGK